MFIRVLQIGHLGDGQDIGENGWLCRFLRCLLMNGKGRAVIGIDAAWTAKEPSGVALVVESEKGWSCRAVAPSYEQFIALGSGETVDWSHRPTGSKPNIKKLLEASQALVGLNQVKVIAVDMPLSLDKITKRRLADSEVSRAYGGKGCAVHSPSALRPGPISDELRIESHSLGFPLAVENTLTKIKPSLIEVYPHPALLSLLNIDYRFPYKVSKRNKFWKQQSPDAKKNNLTQAFNRILACLNEKFININLKIPASDDFCSFADLKRYEDALDSLICAWVGVLYLEGSCIPYGDNKAAIWIPK